MEKKSTTLQRFREIDALGVGIVKRNVLFFCFITVLGLIYIANAHYAESKIRRITALKNELKELNWKYMSMKSAMLEQSSYSTIQSELKNRDLGLRGQSPVKVIVNQN